MSLLFLGALALFFFSDFIGIVADSPMTGNPSQVFDIFPWLIIILGFVALGSAMIALYGLFMRRAR